MSAYRLINFGGFASCALAMLFALYLQRQGFEPCPMCIFQRVAMIATGGVFLVAGLHAPRRRWAQGVYAVLTAVCALLGAAIAGRHVWLQSLPADQVPACGPTLDYLMDFMPLTEVVTLILRGDGNCAKIDAAWLGLSLPAWTLVAFLGLSLLALASLLYPSNRQR